MSTEAWSDHIRRELDKWFTLVIIVLLILMLVSGWIVASGALDNEVETTGEFQHSATVQETNPLFETGTELTNRSTYFTNSTPELDGQFIYSHTGDEEYIVQTQLSMRTRVLDEDGGQLWTFNQELKTDKTTVGPDERHSVPFTIDVEDQAAVTAVVEQSVGDEIETQTQLIVVAQTTVMTDDGTVIRTDEYELPIELFDNIYQVEQGEEGADGFESFPLDTGIVLFIGTLTLFLGSGALLIGLLIARRYDVLAPRRSPNEVHRRERKRFDDWISTGTLPKQYTQEPQIKVDSLQDLVDIAIDCDRRVVEDRTQACYYVIDGDEVYTYSPSGWSNVDEEEADVTLTQDQ